MGVFSGISARWTAAEVFSVSTGQLIIDIDSHRFEAISSRTALCQISAMIGVATGSFSLSARPVVEGKS
jgi:hypothetical protein